MGNHICFKLPSQRFNKTNLKYSWGWECQSVVEDLPSTHVALGSMSSTRDEKKQQKNLFFGDYSIIFLKITKGIDFRCPHYKKVKKICVN
jgi:hypothetical protein